MKNTRQCSEATYNKTYTMKFLKLTLIFTFLIALHANAQILSQWRGENRDGIYNETGLLKQWPEDGPELLWFNDSLPKGYSSPAIDDFAIYTTGIIDTLDYLFALDFTRKMLWKTPVGGAWTNSFSDSRATPTIDGDKLYVESGTCVISCVDKKSGEILWQVDGFNTYEGIAGTWGYSESLVVLDDKVFFTPAGLQTTMVALNKNTGEEVWQTESLNDTAGYVSPILVNENGKNILITVLSNNVFGVDAENGKIMFSHNYSEIDDDRAYALWNSPSASRINTNSPIYYNKEIYVTSGYNHSGVKYKLNDAMNALEVVWTDSVLDVHHGGVVLVDNYLYGANWLNNSQGNWCCVNWETGKLAYETKWNTKGSVIYADGMLYCYEEKRGNLALVEPTPEKFNVISEFRITKGKGPHWSHLVIKDKKLYVRHENALMVFDIAAK